MSRQTLTAEKRDASGRSPEARRLRRAGRVPGVVYKHGESAVSFSADNLELSALIRRGASLVDVTIDGTAYITVVKDYQVHPVRGTLQHIDFQEVRMDEMVNSVVPLHHEGTAPGVKAGGVLVESLHEVHVESTPGNIPESIAVDISGLRLGDTFTLSQLHAPDGVTIIGDPEALVVNISIPRGVSAAGGEGEDEGAEGTTAEASGNAGEPETSGE